jgi:Kyakuja-Dileera-Zisupton transposase
MVNAFLASKACDRTGVAAIACARHGCYVPNALVDLFRGEQQKNVDFAFLQALKTTRVDPQQGVMLIYDIVCQYIIHLRERIGAHLPAGLTIDQGIGLLHVHGHKDECFFRYAPSFIPGSGIVAGEILESLWASLNSISPTVRTATLPHRAEMLDDHATDSNHKKMLGMTVTLCSKFREALEISTQLSQQHAELTTAFGQQAIERWEDQVMAAESLRLTDITVMDMYATQLSETAAASGAATASAAAAGTTTSATATATRSATRSATASAAASGTATASAAGAGAASALVQSAVEQWIDFAILFEQMQ